MPASEKSRTASELPPDRFQRTAFLLALAIITVGFLFMVRHFLLTLFMAAVFTGLAYPAYTFLLKYVKKPMLASAATVVALVLLIVLPISAVVMVAYQEAWTFFQSVDYESLPQSMDALSRSLQEKYPGLFSQLQLTRQEVTAYATQAGQKALEWLLKKGANWSLVAAGGIVNLALMLFIMFYFFIDGKRILDRIIRWSPMPDDYERAVFKRFLVVGRGTLKGIFIIGALQGLLAGILFWIVGLGSPILLGVLTVFATVIPALGAGLVWFPVGVGLLFAGKFGAALTVFLVGGLVISMVDNLLRPAIIGKDIKMHDVMVLVSTLGGLAVFGFPGFIIGPIFAALFLSCWAIFEKMFARELARTRAHVKPPANL